MPQTPLPAGPEERRLGEELVATGRLSQDQLAAALAAQRQRGGTLRRSLVELGLVPDGSALPPSVSRDETLVVAPPAEPDARSGSASPRPALTPAPQASPAPSLGPRPGGLPQRTPVSGRHAPTGPSSARLRTRLGGSARLTAPDLTPPSGAADSSAGRGPPAGHSSRIAAAARVPEDVAAAMADPSRRLGRYALVDELGRGGMGVVYRAWDVELRRTVAIKAIHDSLLDNHKERERFHREAQAAARLSHPVIVAVHEAGQHEGRPFLVMDYIRGETFAELQKREPLPARRVAEIVRDLARGLDHAHDQGVIHRDVKPQNVLLDAEGRPRLVDFGLAQSIDVDRQLTRTGQLIGTPHYVSPEQARGDLTSIGPHSDVYQLGGVLYWALTGSPPFHGATLPEILGKVFTTDPEPLRALAPEVHPDLETIALRCLEKEPRRRYLRASDLAAELDRFIRGDAIRARPIGRLARLVRWAGRNRALAVTLGIGGVLVVALAAGGVVAAAWAAAGERRAAEARARDQARAAWEAFETARAAVPVVDDADAAVDPGARDRRRRALDGVLAAGLEAVAATGRALAVHPEDDAVRRLAFDAALAFGEVALETEQWGLAATAFQRAAATGVDADRAAAALEAVAVERARVETLAREAVLGVLADLREGAYGVGVADVEDAVFALVRHPTPTTVGLLADELDATSAAIRESARAIYLEAREPDAAERARGEGSIDGLAEAVDWALDPASRGQARPELAARLERALVRIVTRHRDAGGAVEGADPLFSARIVERLGAPRLLTARACCEALGRIGLPAPRALASLADYIDAELDQRRAAVAGEALCRIATPEAVGLAVAARRRLGLRGPYWEIVSRRLERSETEVELAAETWADYMDHGVALMAKRDLAGAIEAFTAAITLDPTRPLAWNERARAKYGGGDPGGAIADFDRAIELAPRNALFHSSRGGAKFQVGDHRGALADLALALELDRNHAPAWANRGVIRYSLGDHPGAIEDLSRALELAPGDANAWHHRGRAHYALGRFEAAASDLGRALELDDGLVECWNDRGASRLATGDLDGATADLTRALQLDPHRKGTWANRGFARARRGDWRGALADLDEALALDAAYAHALCTRAGVKLELGDVAGGHADAARALELDASLVYAWGYLARARRLGGDPGGASEVATRALATDRTAAFLWGERGLARRALGDAGFREDLERALQLGGDLAQAPAWRAALR